MKLIKPEFGSDVKSIGYRLDLLEGQKNLSRSIDEDAKLEENVLSTDKPKEESNKTNILISDHRRLDNVRK